MLNNFLQRVQALMTTSFCEVDVVGILEQAGPLTNFTNRNGLPQACVEFIITDMLYVFILSVTTFIIFFFPNLKLSIILFTAHRLRQFSTMKWQKSLIKQSKMQSNIQLWLSFPAVKLKCYQVIKQAYFTQYISYNLICCFNQNALNLQNS